MKKQFYNECYCDTGALSRDALISQQILEARYASLFPSSEATPALEPAVPASSPHGELHQQIMIEALARRPIVILGDVGVGKTSFLEDLMYVRAPGEFDRAITIYIDLGAKATLSSNLEILLFLTSKSNCWKNTKLIQKSRALFAVYMILI